MNTENGEIGELKADKLIEFELEQLRWRVGGSVWRGRLRCDRNNVHNSPSSAEYSRVILGREDSGFDVDFLDGG